jgi:DNA-binding response OmpR family regulator
MKLQSLVFCSDEKIVRVLRRVLSDLEIHVEHCSESASAVHKLTRQRFEAVIVDCVDEATASQVLRSARTAPSNKRAIAVAIIDDQQGVGSAFGLGAHFVLYKPISMERAKSSFRAARALMRCERRRNLRMPVSIPLILSTADGGRQQTVTTDLGEGGMAVQSCRADKHNSGLRIQMTLPGSESDWECQAEVAWENAGRSAGLRFTEVSPEAREQLRAWLSQRSPDMEQDDPPVACKLREFSAGACYLETTMPFPIRARVLVAATLAERRFQVTGVVRMMHPENGMGIEWTRNTEGQKKLTGEFISALGKNRKAKLEVLVEPDGLETLEQLPWNSRPKATSGDPLLDLFLQKSQLSSEAFLAELEKARPHKNAATATLSI